VSPPAARRTTIPTPLRPPTAAHQPIMPPPAGPFGKGFCRLSAALSSTVGPCGLAPWPSEAGLGVGHWAAVRQGTYGLPAAALASWRCGKQGGHRSTQELSAFSSC